MVDDASIGCNKAIHRVNLLAFLDSHGKRFKEVTSEKVLDGELIMRDLI